MKTPAPDAGPFHGTIYFSPEAAASYEAAGLLGPLSAGGRGQDMRGPAEAAAQRPVDHDPAVSAGTDGGVGVVDRH